MYRDGFHARSVDGRHHHSRDWAKGFWAKRSQDIPQDWRVCGENLWAKHSIRYGTLASYFLGFSIWNDSNVCLSWDDTLDWFALLDIVPVTLLYRGPWDEAKIRSLYVEERDRERCEGYVVRPTRSFRYKDFKSHVGKFVRRDHVQTTHHWMFGSKIERNETRMQKP